MIASSMDATASCTVVNVEGSGREEENGGGAQGAAGGRRRERAFRSRGGDLDLGDLDRRLFFFFLVSSDVSPFFFFLRLLFSFFFFSSITRRPRCSSLVLAVLVFLPRCSSSPFSSPLGEEELSPPPLSLSLLLLLLSLPLAAAISRASCRAATAAAGSNEEKLSMFRFFLQIDARAAPGD